MRKRGSKWILGVILLAGCLLYGQMTVSAKEQEPMTVETTRRQAKATGARLNFTNVKKEFNVLDYGASVTSKNNYKAFQKTIDEAHKYQQKHPDEQCKIVIPGGVYDVKDKDGHGLIIYSNLWIYAQGATIRRTTPYKRNLMQTVGTGGGYAGTKNVLIEGGIWDGLGSVTKNTNPIFRFVHASDIEFLNCTVQNSFNAHHLEMGGIKGLSILGCTFSDYSQDKASLKKEAVQLDICNNSSIMPGCEVYDDARCQNVLIKNNTFTELYRAIGTHSAVVGKYMSNITISDNFFSDIKGKAIGMYNYKNCNIVHNTFVDCSEAIDFRSVSMSDSYGKNFYAPADGSKVKAQPLTANLVIADNVIRKDRMSGHDTGGAMIRVFGTHVRTSYTSNGKTIVPAGDYSIKNVVIERNRVSGKAAGIILNDVKNATLRNNIIYECDKHGLQITENSTVTLKGINKIYSNEKNGISCGSSKLKLQGSTKIYRNGATGLYIYKSKNADIRKLITCSNGGAGITLTGTSSAVIKNPSVRGNKHYGIIAEKKSKLKLEGGTVAKNAESGVFAAEQADVSLRSGVKIEQNKGTGVSVSSGAVKIYDCEVQKNKKSGVELQLYSKANLKGNTIIANRQSGIYASTSRLTIKENVITDNRRYGVAMYQGSRATSLRDNQFSNGAKEEILLVGGSSAPVRTTKAIRINWLASYSNRITGRAQPGARVTATYGSRNLGSSKTTKQGKYTIKINRQNRNTVITITARDGKNNQFQREATVR